ncbi:L-threonylcarbamoyladenylate synthase [Rhodoluna sp. KAS3]|uniref:L-threonylcarbamoyladenylate synthase n=1 Tax=Rhodoluna sp. KAS3 TaxID=942880 RepID=UPI00222ED6B0|nr:L-threonylcarbamoyladenylate synthase [Rhodoluna sp. KAS3]BDS48793.1 threonylcarbamoyl-AMP synthase [Rhodoluna sp. KAS3]
MQRVFDCSVDTDLLTGMRRAKVSLGRGELVVLPTDTVYGIGCDAFSAKGVQALLAAKGRTPQSPPPVLIGNVNTLHALAEDVPDVARRLADTFWPGALTMILRAQPSLNWDLGETKGTVALRMPDHKIALALLEDVGPMAVSSANLTGQPAATTCAQAYDYLGESVQVYLDSGNSPKGEASTIIDLTGITDSYDADGNLSTTGKIRIVRRGALSDAKLRSVAGDLLEGAN